MLHFITVSSNSRGESEITRDARPRFSVGRYSFVAYFKSNILLVQNYTADVGPCLHKGQNPVFLITPLIYNMFQYFVIFFVAEQ